MSKEATFYSNKSLLWYV